VVELGLGANLYIDSWLPVHDPSGSGCGCRCTITRPKKYHSNTIPKIDWL